MKWSYLTLLMLFSSETADAQPGQKIKLNDTTYYEDFGLVSAKETSSFYGIVKQDTGNSYSVTQYYTINNQLKTNGHYSDLDQGTRIGIFEHYYKSGLRKSKGAFEHNKETGHWEHYRDTLDAPLWVAENYREGVPDGDLTTYYPNGKLRRREMHSPSLKVNKSVIVSSNGTEFRTVDTEALTDSIVSGVCYDTNGKEIPFTPLTVEPKPGYDLQRYLAASIRYPMTALENNREGKVIVGFKIGENGEISDIKIVKKTYPELDKEAIRVVSAMPKWTPGTYDDKPVEILFTVQVNFAMD